ncbi:ATPase/histidine kinase/DNA gyrase B/HSP90 domain protein [delta proteobacterium NaphS2]|nr:ATPase/histidine kinase/DNA gyrase B/HSP90 domain protein [delta proteobacterium NaphS2]
MSNMKIDNEKEVNRGLSEEVNRVLSEIASALVGQFEMSMLLDQVVNTAMRTLNAEVCSIFLEEKENEPGIITMMAGSGFAKTLVGIAKYKIGEAFTGYVAQSGKRFNIRTRHELESLTIEGNKVWEGKHDKSQWPTGVSQFRNLIALPLKIKGQTLGVMKVENKDEKIADYFSEDDERYLETIANVVALAIENARLHERVAKQLKAIAAKASHRIGNQLTNYDGIELDLYDEAQRLVPDKTTLKQLSERIGSTTRGIKSMMDEFQNYGKPMKLIRAPALFNKIVEDEAWLAKPPQGVTIEKDLDPTLTYTSIDAMRFGEAFKELFRNSLKAINDSGAGSKIVVRTKLTVENSILVTVEDDGPGIPDDFPVFEPFQAASPSSTGLGLATVKELVEAHGGRITSDSDCALGGACISFELPIT